MRHVSAYKKLLLFITLAVVALAASASTIEAQGYRRHSRVVVGGGYYGYPGPYFYGSPRYGAQWGPYPYPPPYGYYGWIDASVRLEVTPRDAEVYVDGYYAGTVDDFDGTFQRLRVEPGPHDLEIYKEGFRPLRQKAYLSADNTFPIKQALQPLARGRADGAAAAAGESAAGRAAVRTAAAGCADAARPLRPSTPPPPQGGEPRGTQPPEPRGGQPSGAYGSVSIRVQPADAEVSIDGDVWRGPPARIGW